MHYANGRDMAWHALIDTKSVTFPLRLSPILDYYGISAVSESDVGISISSHYAQALSIQGQPYIVCKDTSHKPRLRFSIAHEIGHIVLGHTYSELDAAYLETEANVFASRILMPAIVCKLEGLATVKQIADFFNVSVEAAAIRAERIRVLLERDKFLVSPLEREYYYLYTRK